MSKAILLLFILFLYNTAYTQNDPELVDIPAQVFVNKGKTNLEKIIFKDPILRKKVQILYQSKELSHDLSSNFKSYWKNYHSQWFSIQFRENGDTLLLFKGLKNKADEREFVQIYNLHNAKNYRLAFSSVGRLLAYKIHPFTNGLILFIHKYPCCRSASHNIFTIRYLHHKIRVKKRFFVGRDKGDMVGPFFPKKVKHTNSYTIAQDSIALRWSPAIVTKNAFKNWTNSNLMIHYTKGAVYKVLYQQKDGWKFVVFFSGIAKEHSSILNYTNFEHRGVYGWIKE